MSYSSLTPLQGRIAVVTGGTKGIGFESAKALQENGATVIVIGLDPERGELVSRTLGVDFRKGDVRNSETVASLAQEIRHQYGRIDIAFNSAGISASVPAEETTDAQWSAILQTNLNGLFYCCREFGKVMLEQGSGSIINAASISGLVSNTPQPQAAYNVSKAGVIMLTKSLAGEWAKRGVRVNALSPGYVNTPMTQGGMANLDWLKRWGEFTPMGRVSESTEIASVVVFLASDASSYFTGSNLVMDGGYTCW